MSLDDDDLRAGEGRYREVSNRIGRHRGRAARTYHCHIAVVKSSNGDQVDYLARLGDYVDRDDLEHLAGDPAAFQAAAELVDHARRLKNGRTAEAVLKTEVFELPADSTPTQRREIAELAVTRWNEMGHQAVAAVHAPRRSDDGKLNFHIHLAVVARPIRHGQADRRPGTIPWSTKRSVMAERQVVAEMVNAICQPAVVFWGGRDAKMDQPGIRGRKPRHRVPERAWRLCGQRDIDPGQVQATRGRQVATRTAAIEQRTMKAAQAELRRLNRLERLGGVDKGVLQQTNHLAQSKIDQLLQATSRQAAMILAIGKEAGVEVSPDQLERLDGGDLVAAVRRAKAGDRADFETRIAAAEKRAAEAGGTVMDKDRETRRRSMFEAMFENAAARPAQPAPAAARPATPNQPALRTAPKEPLAVPQSMSKEARASLRFRLASYTPESLVALGETTAMHYRQLTSRRASSAADSRGREEYRTGAMMVAEQIRAVGCEPGAELSRLIAPRPAPTPSPGGRGRDRDSL